MPEGNAAAGNIPPGQTAASSPPPPAPASPGHPPGVVSMNIGPASVTPAAPEMPAEVETSLRSWLNRRGATPIPAAEEPQPAPPPSAATTTPQPPDARGALGSRIATGAVGESESATPLGSRLGGGTPADTLSPDDIPAQPSADDITGTLRSVAKAANGSLLGRVGETLHKPLEFVSGGEHYKWKKAGALGLTAGAGAASLTVARQGHNEKEAAHAAGEDVSLKTHAKGVLGYLGAAGSAYVGFKIVTEPPHDLVLKDEFQGRSAEPVMLPPRR